MKLHGLRFPSPPPLGTSILVDASQSYVLLEVRDYRRVDGKQSNILVWQTSDPENGEVFTVKTGLGFKEFAARRAPGNRKPGRIVPLVRPA